MANFVSAAIYLIGAGIIYQTGVIWMVLYILYILILEFRLLKGHCINCYYYGKTCAFGKGKTSKIFFKKGDLKNFCKKQITWKDLMPELLVSLMPAIIGIVILIKKFNWIMLVLVVLLFILTFSGNGFVRSKLACRYCKQKKLGCPAQKLFEKNR